MSVESLNPLDATLPTELQGIVTHEETEEPKGGIMPETKDLIAGAVASLSPLITEDKIKSIVSDALSAAERAKAVASEIQGLKDAGTKFKSELDTAIKAGVEKAGELASASDKLTKAEAALVEANKKIAEMEKINKATATELNKVKAEKAIAERTRALADAKLNTPERLAKLTELNPDGTLKITDDVFTATVAELKAVFEAGKASIPAPAAPAAAPAAASATAPVQATASNAAPAAPAAPDLSRVDIGTQAIAALASGAQSAPTVAGQSKFAKMFPAGL